MVEFLFTEDNNSVDSEEQPSEYFYDVSTSNVLNNMTLHNIIFVDLKHHLEFRYFISQFLFSNTLSQYWFRHWFLKFAKVLCKSFQLRSLSFLPNKEICENCVFRQFLP